MTIPSDHPSTPPTPPASHLQPTSHAPPAPLPKSSVDPTGQWAKFLGPTATAEDVKMFIQGMLKMFNVLIQQEQRAAKRASDALKKSIKGE